MGDVVWVVVEEYCFDGMMLMFLEEFIIWGIGGGLVNVVILFYDILEFLIINGDIFINIDLIYFICFYC